MYFYLVSYLLFFFFLFFSIYKRKGLKLRLEKFILFLNEISTVFQAGLISKIRELFTPESDDPVYVAILKKELRRAHFAGLAMASSLLTFNRIVKQNLMLDKEKGRFLQLLVSRALIVVLMAFSGRIFVEQAFSLNLRAIDKRMDLICLGLSFVLIVGAVSSMRKLLPSSWIFSNDGLSSLGLSWFFSLLNLFTDQSAPFYGTIKEMETTSLITGISITKQKREFLVSWSEEKHYQESYQLKQSENLLPFIEIFGFGTAALLIILMPIISLFDRFLGY